MVEMNTLCMTTNDVYWHATSIFMFVPASAGDSAYIGLGNHAK